MSRVDLFYSRPSCESCAVTRDLLREGAVEIALERSTREPFTEADIRGLLRQVDEVVIGRGRRAERRAARDVRPDDLRGPTGGFRAPMLRVGRLLLVGLHRPTLAELFPVGGWRPQKASR
jgi:hypothetical protein